MSTEKGSFDAKRVISRAKLFKVLFIGAKKGGEKLFQKINREKITKGKKKTEKQKVNDKKRGVIKSLGAGG